MPDRWGRPVANDWLNIGSAIGGVMQDQKRDAKETAQAEREKRVKSAAMGVMENPDQDLSGLELDERFDVSREVAKAQADKLRMNREFELQKARKRSNARLQYLDGINKAEMALNNGDTKTAAYLLAQASPNAPTGWGAEVQEDPESGQVFLAAKNRLTDETQSIPATEEALRDLINQGKKWRDVKDFDAASREMDNWRRVLNEKLSSQREVLRDENGIPRGVRYQALIPDENGALTSDRKWVYLNENLQEVSPDQMAGLIPDSHLQGQEGMAKHKAYLAKSQYDTDFVNAKRDAISAIDPKRVYRTEKGYIGVDNAGRVNSVQPEIAKELMPAEESKYSKVTNDQGEYTFIKEPGKTETRGVIGTGVKAPEKANENKVYTVKNPITGSETQESGKEIRINLKEIKAFLGDVKDNSGNTFILPDYDEFMNSSRKKKETVLAKIERLARDPKQSTRVRIAAGQALGYMEALGITSGKNDANTNWLKSKIKHYSDQAAVMP